jgi:hypothetical protein
VELYFFSLLFFLFDEMTQRIQHRGPHLGEVPALHACLFVHSFALAPREQGSSVFSCRERGGAKGFEPKSWFKVLWSRRFCMRFVLLINFKYKFVLSIIITNLDAKLTAPDNFELIFWFKVPPPLPLVPALHEHVATHYWMKVPPANLTRNFRVIRNRTLFVRFSLLLGEGVGPMVFGLNSVRYHLPSF